MTYRLPFAGQRLMPGNEFLPGFDVFPDPITAPDGRLYLGFDNPVVFPLVTAPFFHTFGPVGLYIIPVVSGWLVAVLSGVLAAWFSPPSRTVGRSARRPGHARVVLQRRLLGAHPGVPLRTAGGVRARARPAPHREHRGDDPRDAGRDHAARRDAGAGGSARHGVGGGRRQRLAPAGHVDERSDGAPPATASSAIGAYSCCGSSPPSVSAPCSASRCRVGITPSFASCRSASTRRSAGCPNIPQGLFEVFINSQHLGPAVTVGWRVAAAASRCSWHCWRR